MGVRYIGSKARVAGVILDLVGEPDGGRFVDAFAGTGSVAAEAVSRGWPVAVNDSLPSAVAMSVAATVGRGNVPFKELAGYEAAVELLNSVEPAPGFLHDQYSPASAATAPVERKYFTEGNASRLDAMRSQIREWSVAGALTKTEERLLLADLLEAANSVANISGTYGCFLKSWTAAALRSVELRPRPLPDRTADFIATVGDASETPTVVDDTVYLDPPYTKRQYAAYYHILETIYAGDAPEVGGVTGLRPWKDKASDYCYKTRALGALSRLVASIPSRRVFLSYSNEGHVPQDKLVEALGSLGDVELHEVATIGRYRPNAKASATGETVNEYVIEVTRPSRANTNRVA